MVPHVVNVGFTGHRARNGMDLNAVGQSLTAVFQFIKQLAEEITRDWGGNSGRPPLELRLLCGMAEGADLAAACTAEAEGTDYQVHAVLPFARDEFVKDFTAHGLVRFDLMMSRVKRTLVLGYRPAAEPRNAAYEGVGRSILMHSDLVVAVWDGIEGSGRGGTASVVAEARAARVPLIWVHAIRPDEITLCCPAQEGMDERVSLNEGRARLRQLLLPLLQAPIAAPGRRKSHQELLHEYVGRDGNIRCGWMAARFRKVWPLVARALIWPPPEVDARNVYKERAFPPIDSMGVIRVEYDRANNASQHYAEMYRSGFFVNYILSALAVTFAVAALLSFYNNQKELATVLSVGEILVLMAILFTYRALRRKGWQEKLTDYRLLAELLRHQLVLSAVGLAVRLPRPAAFHADSPHKQWTVEYLRRLVRSAGVAGIDLSAPAVITQTVAALRDDWIGGQVAYHKGNDAKLYKLEHRLHGVSVATFILALMAALAHIVLVALGFEPRSLPILVTFATVIGPAWASAFHAIAQQAELRRLHLRSRNMSSVLEEFHKRLLDGEPPFGRLVSLVNEAADAMVSEAIDWRFHYRVTQTTP